MILLEVHSHNVIVVAESLRIHLVRIAVDGQVEFHVQALSEGVQQFILEADGRASEHKVVGRMGVQQYMKRVIARCVSLRL